MPSFTKGAQKYPIKIFHHLPKTAGTSLRQLLAEHFTIRSDYRNGAVTPPRHDPNGLSESDLICGHFDGACLPKALSQPANPYILERRYPEVFNRNSCFAFTFLRNPLEAVISNYFFRHKWGLPVLGAGDWGRPPDLNSLARHCLNDKNWYAQILGIRYSHEIKGRLALYQFVGTVEHFEDSVRSLGAILGVPLAANFRKANESKRDSSIVTSLMNWPSFQREFAQDNLDFHLYRQALTILEQTSAGTRAVADHEGRT